MGVDELLATMAHRYGDAFASVHAGRDPHDVRAEWLQVLRSVEPSAVVDALDNMPAYPLSALGFHALALHYAPPTVQRVIAPPAPGTHSAAKAKALERLRELRREFARGKA